MKLIRLSTYALLVAMLVGCSGNEGDNETASENNQAVKAETNNGAETTGESSNNSSASENDHASIISEALAFAGESTAHEGTLKVLEQVDRGTETLKEQTLEIEYAQNEMAGSEDDGYQLAYKKVQYSSELDGIRKSDFYRQPGVADYKLYEPENFWHANDYSQIDASIEERLDYMSPYDVLTLYEKYKNEAKVIIDSEESLMLAFEVSEDVANASDLDFQFLEPESFLYTGEYSFSPASYTMMIDFDKAEKTLRSVHVEVHYKDSNDESLTMMIQSLQTFNSYMLTGEIMPPEQAFTETGLNKWDF